MSKEKLLALAIAIGLSFGTAGCNTIEGAGKDVQGAGKAIENTAEDVHEDIKN